VLLWKAQLIIPLPVIYIGNSITEYKGTARLLGATLDQNLSWIPHVKEVIKNVAKNIEPPEEIQVSTQTWVRVFFFYVKVIQPNRTRCLSGLGLVRQSYLKY